MLFKDLKPGYPVYILQKENEPKAFQGKTIKVSEPYFLAKTLSILVHKDAVPSAIAKKLCN